MSGYAPQQQVIYQQIVKAPTNGLAVTALVLGIVAIVFGVWIPVPFLGAIMMFIAFIPAVLAVVFGHLGLRNSRRNGVGRGGSLTGLALGYATIGLSVFTTVAWIAAAAAGAGAASTSTL